MHTAEIRNVPDALADWQRAMKEREDAEKTWRVREAVVHEHKDSGWRCLVNHPDGKQCFRCMVCGEWIGH